LPASSRPGKLTNFLQLARPEHKGRLGLSGLLDLGTIARLPVVVGSLRFAGPEQYGEVASSLGLAGAENEARWLDCQIKR